MKLPAEIRERFQSYGREGGLARSANLDALTRKAIARRAVTARWIRHRFDASNLTDLELPGADLVDAGLSDLAGEVTTIESLLVSLAAPRLRREGIPIGRVEPNPEERLYDLLSQTAGDLAHSRYNAYLRRIVSLANACNVVRARRAS